MTSAAMYIRTLTSGSESVGPRRLLLFPPENRPRRRPEQRSLLANRRATRGGGHRGVMRQIDVLLELRPWQPGHVVAAKRPRRDPA